MNIRKVAYITTAFVAATVAAGAYSIFGVQTEAQKFVAACEAELLGQLESPSSYKFVSAAPVVRSKGDALDIIGVKTAEDYRKVKEDEARSEAVKQVNAEKKRALAAGELIRISTVIKYDAANSYGAVIRGSAECSDYIGIKQSYLDVLIASPRIDG